MIQHCTLYQGKSAKALTDVILSLIRNTRFLFNSRAVSFKTIRMTFGHFAAMGKLPLKIFLQHPEFDAMIPDSKGYSILQTFMFNYSMKKFQTKASMKRLLNHRTTDVSKLNAKGESVIDFGITQFVAKRMNDEAYIEWTRLLSTHPTASNDQINTSLTVLVDMNIKVPEIMARLASPDSKDVAAYQSCIAEICSSGLYAINTKNEDGSTVAHLAALAGNEVAMKIFIDTEGFDPNVQDGNGNTAWFYVIANFTVDKVGSFIGPAYRWDLNIKITSVRLYANIVKVCLTRVDGPGWEECCRSSCQDMLGLAVCTM